MIRRWALVILLFCFCAACSHSQNGNSELLKEAEKDLRSGKASVSTILSAKKYEPIHPETAFRELIKLHTTTEPLLISFPEEPGKKIRVLATIKNEAGEPLPNILVYMYQTDTGGWYSAE
jgi:protocatechuate 3,4-dioxygenase beta subunit